MFDSWVGKISWRREWQPTPVFLSGEFHGPLLAGYSPWHRKKSDMTEHLALQGFPGGASGKELTCQCRRHERHRFDPWVWKIPWRRAWQLTPVFLPGESQGQKSLGGYSPSSCRVGMTEVTEHMQCMYVSDHLHNN